jgi:hypothetical protein
MALEIARKLHGHYFPTGLLSIFAEGLAKRRPRRYIVGKAPLMAPRT